MSNSPYFNPYAPIDIHERKLPHWQQVGVFYFLTWRLADSIPQLKLDQWMQERVAWLARNHAPFTAQQKLEYKRLFPAKIESWLDQGWGSCLLRDWKRRMPLLDALDREDAECLAWAIMPNHVHVVIKLPERLELTDWAKSVKGRSARFINKRSGRRGALWQAGYWDRIVRDRSHLYRCFRYIARNPLNANLPSDAYDLLLPAAIGREFEWRLDWGPAILDPDLERRLDFSPT